VLERADGLRGTPDWASITRPSFEESGKKYFLGYVELDGEVSKSGALNMADEKALSEPMRSLVDEFLDQNQVGENVRRESTFGQRIISATRGFRAPMPTLTIVKRYWEVVATSPYTTATRAYSLAEISLPEFERAKQEYFDRLAGNGEMRQILREVGKKQRENILNTNTPKS
jgi:hypothetical protein